MTWKQWTYMSSMSMIDFEGQSRNNLLSLASSILKETQVSYDQKRSDIDSPSLSGIDNVDVQTELTGDGCGY
jgi:hypothetical protein